MLHDVLSVVLIVEAPVEQLVGIHVALTSFLDRLSPRKQCGACMHDVSPMMTNHQTPGGHC
jgi:hypothetical protein